MSDRTKHSTAPTRAISIHLPRVSTNRQREPDYPFHDRAIRVTRCGRICIGRRKINLSTAFAGQTVGVTEVDDQIWLVSFSGLRSGILR